MFFCCFQMKQTINQNDGHIRLEGNDNKNCNSVENLSVVKGRNLAVRRGSNKQYVAIVLFVCYFTVFV